MNLSNDKLIKRFLSLGYQHFLGLATLLDLGGWTVFSFLRFLRRSHIMRHSPHVRKALVQWVCVHMLKNGMRTKYKICIDMYLKLSIRSYTVKDDSKSTVKPKAQENGLTLSIRVIESKVVATCR